MLTLMSEIFEEWIKCQRQWMYLEPIFSSDDIMKQLPTEGKRFQNVDRTWRKLLGGAAHDPDAISFCKTPRLLPSFTDSNQMLDQVSKGLSEYLETKRAAFSRFYFLSNDELLEILSQSKDPCATASTEPPMDGHHDGPSMDGHHDGPSMDGHHDGPSMDAGLVRLPTRNLRASPAPPLSLTPSPPPAFLPAQARRAAAPVQVLRERQQARVPAQP